MRSGFADIGLRFWKITVRNLVTWPRSWSRSRGITRSGKLGDRAMEVVLMAGEMDWVLWTWIPDLVCEN